ncbi:hypothetical protein OQA88_3458 [Cercophora sp. LCS_1]
MAIIPCIDGLEATVQVNGTTAMEYDSPNKAPPDNLTFDISQRNNKAPYVVKYIEAKVDEPFGMVVLLTEQLNRDNHHVAFGFSIDGKSMELLHCINPPSGAPHELPWGFNCASFAGVDGAGNEVTYPYCFGALKFVDPDNLPHGQKGTGKALGLLRIKIYRMHAGVVETLAHSRYKPVLEADVISEKAFKGEAIDSRAR